MKIKFFKFVLMSIFVFSLTLIFSNDVHAQSTVSPKDTYFSVALSIIDPSFGMFYLGETRLAALYWTIDKVAFFSAFILVFDIRVSLPESFGLNVEFRLRDYNVYRVVSASILGAVFLGFRIFAIIDTRNRTFEFNKRLFEDKFYITESGPVNLFIMTDKPLGVGVRFDL